MATFAHHASPTQFAASVIGVELSDPPADRKGNVAFGNDASCWLCGGPTDGKGWPQEAAISPTFTQNNLARTQDSGTVCSACAALTKAKTFQAAVAKHGLDIKIWTQAGWHCYSHLVIAPGTYECPKPSRVRDILLDPPHEPFLLGINASGQKHSVFRCRVATDRDVFPVHFDDETFDVDRARFVQVLETLEELSKLGFSKDQSASGRYHPESIRRAGLSVWRPLEEQMQVRRQTEQQLLGLAVFCGRSPTYFRSLEEGKK